MNIKLKCLLLDDELPGLTYLKMLCEQLPELEVVKAFNNPETFLAELPSLDFDLCILDVEMPGMNGLQVANLLKGKPVIFTTAYKEFAAEAFDLDAVDYVQKPVQKERLAHAVQKAIQRVGNQQAVKKFIQINTDKGKALLHFNRIGLISTSDMDSRDKIAYLKDNTTICLKNITFDKILELLPPQQFCRINKKEVISLAIVKVFTFDEITIDLLSPSGKPMFLTLSEIYKTGFLERVRI